MGSRWIYNHNILQVVCDLAASELRERVRTCLVPSDTNESSSAMPEVRNHPLLQRRSRSSLVLPVDDHGEFGKGLSSFCLSHLTNTVKRQSFETLHPIKY
jgi:hypothetical protein